MATVEPHAARPAKRPSRGAEAGLLVLALAIGIGAYALVGFGLLDEVPEQFVPYSLGLVALAVVGHVVLRIKAPYADQVMLPVVVALNGLGLAMISRLDIGGQLVGSTKEFASRQFMWTALGVVAACAVVWFLKDHRTLRKYSYTAMIVGLVLVMMPLLPGIGQNINGARIWVNIADFSLQPAEFAKIAFAIFFAGYLVTNRDTLALAGPKVLGLQLPRLRDLGPLVIVWGASLAVLIFERDLGTSLLFFGLFVAMLYIATERFSWVVIGLSMFAVGAVVAASVFPHVAARVDVWLHPLDPEIFGRSPGGSGQLVGGMFGLANGGLTGTGWGQGYPRLVPYANSDFIYTSLGEELGLAGLLAILVMYLVLVERGLRTAIGVRDGFGKLLAGGLAFVMAWQLFVVIGGITRIIPLTGLTMPFVAHGGSSLLANWLVIGLLLRISDNARRPSSLPVRGQVAAHAAGPTSGSQPVAVGSRSQEAVDAGEARAAVGPARGGPSQDHPTQVVRTDLPENAEGPMTGATEIIDDTERKNL
ncbi:FtsW/RodA/SpoVE family cell cycle protein [Oerskovia sp. Sa1BUA8]|uniref:FtsW/RodA/SpoVE family cell cycle protein n=1 Tax=Oerskovia douganii TaxID=2762210 RepID=A0A9D5YYT4_9CELL|nr:FtsW/RodA/SpoVE family cell cycle protein [Oerskovia douganii]MBE7700222.1 FtsW/RodA/SpoVE family cell cycle protein [Oerskovia douganii]